jgi:serine/threonine protein kinase
MVSELIDGCDLARLVKSRRVSIDESMRIVAKVAQALHHGHEHGVIHRDIKPHNILLDKFREPFVTDFGIAVTEAEIAADTASTAGTPAYMAPEQANPSGTRLDRRCDVYSLGVVLYELLVGTSPYAGQTITALRVAHRQTIPRSPKSLVPEISDELNRICMQALELAPDQRWNSAEAFGNAILGVLAVPPQPPPAPNEPVLPMQSEQASPRIAVKKATAKFAANKARRSRNSDSRIIANFLIGSLAVLVTILLVVQYGEVGRSTSLKQVDASKRTNTAAEDEGRVADSVEISGQLARAAALARQIPATEEHVKVPSSPVTEQTTSNGPANVSSDFDNDNAFLQDTGTPIRTLGNGPPLPTEIRRSEPQPEPPVSDKMDAVAMATSSTVTEPADIGAVAREPVAAKRRTITSVSKLHTFRGLTGTVRCCQFSPDEKYVLAAGTVKPNKVWNVATGREVCQLDHDGRYAFFDGPDQIVTLGRQNKACYWSFPSGSLLSTRTFRGCLTTGEHSLSRDLAVYVTKSAPTVFDFASGRDIWTIPTSRSTFCVAISDDGTLVVTGEKSGAARLWSTSTRREVRELARFNTYVQACAISPDKKLALAASWNNTTRIINVATGALVRSHSGTMLPMSAEFSPDGRRYAVGCNGKILVWSTATGKQVASIVAHGNKYVESLSFSRDGTKLLSGGRDSAVNLWQLPTR